MNHRSYYAFDVLTDETASAVDCLFGYTGKMFDDVTTLQNNVNRWYNPTLGKWLSEDPIGFNGMDVNLYRYVGNDAVAQYDAYGLKVVKCQQMSSGGLNPTPMYGPSCNTCIPVGVPKFVRVPDYFEGNPCDAGWTTVPLSKDEEDFIRAANGDEGTELGVVQILNSINKAGGLSGSYVDSLGFFYRIKKPTPYYIVI